MTPLVVQALMITTNNGKQFLMRGCIKCSEPRETDPSDSYRPHLGYPFSLLLRSQIWAQTSCSRSIYRCLFDWAILLGFYILAQQEEAGQHNHRTKIKEPLHWVQCG